jgi:hypothetical protein
MVLADMRRAGLVAPDGPNGVAEYLGSRIDGGARILIWRVGEWAYVEQRVPIFNVGVTARRRAFHVVK